MQKISSVAELKYAIQLLETERVTKGQLLKDQFSMTCKSLKPVNLLTNTFNKVFSTSNFVENLSGTSLGVAGGLLVRKLIIGSSNNIIRKLIGSFIQFGFAEFISHNSEVIKSVGHSIIQHLFRRKEARSERHSSSGNE
jgi:hypothetical protein